MALVVEVSKLIPYIKSPVRIKYFWYKPWKRYGFNEPDSIIIIKIFPMEKIAFRIKKTNTVRCSFSVSFMSTANLNWCRTKKDIHQNPIAENKTGRYLLSRCEGQTSSCRTEKAIIAT